MGVACGRHNNRKLYKKETKKHTPSTGSVPLPYVHVVARRQKLRFAVRGDRLRRRCSLEEVLLLVILYGSRTSVLGPILK